MKNILSDKIQILDVESLDVTLRKILKDEIPIVMKSYLKNESLKLYDKHKAAEILDVSLSTIDNLRRSGDLNSLSVGGRIKFRKDDIQRYIESKIIMN